MVNIRWPFHALPPFLPHYHFVCAQNPPRSLLLIIKAYIYWFHNEKSLALLEFDWNTGGYIQTARIRLKNWKPPKETMKELSKCARHLGVWVGINIWFQSAPLNFNVRPKKNNFGAPSKNQKEQTENQQTKANRDHDVDPLLFHEFMRRLDQT